MPRIDEDLIANYMAEIILSLNITPRTTLTAPSEIGDVVVHVQDAAPFTARTTATWWDMSDEPELEMLSTDPLANTITFATPLTKSHEANAVLATNLLDYRPTAFGLAVVKDDPLVFVTPLGVKPGYVTNNRVGGPVILLIQFNVLDEQREAEVHPNLWTKRQQQRCHVGLSLILSALYKNPHLKTPTREPIATILGNRRSPELGVVTYDRFVTLENVPIFAAAGSITVNPIPQTA